MSWNEAWAFLSEGAPSLTSCLIFGVHNQSFNVLVVGCNLTGNSESGLYLLEVASALPANVFIRDCDVTGYSAWSVALNIASTATSVQVTNCAGYNDQSPAFITSPLLGPPTGAFYNHTYGYFGPVSFYVGVTPSGTTVLIGGNGTLLSTGAFYLAPGQSGQVDFNPATKPTFQVIGQ